MRPFELRLETPAGSSADPATTFFWTQADDSTIDARQVSRGRIGPRLGSLGPVSVANVDFVRIAAAVFAADRSVSREGGGSSWNQRRIHLTVPLVDSAPWTAVHDRLTAVVDLLSGDRWSFEFTDGETAAEDVAERDDAPSRIVLLSGGADSAIGALRSRSELVDGAGHTLVSHYTTNGQPKLQGAVAAQIAALIPGRSQRHVQAKLARVPHTVTGHRFADEPTQRSRSLLFLALGLAIASTDGVEVWIPENGFASLNPPLGPERLGAVSTRTTHPAFLAGLSDLLNEVGAHAAIVNPFASMTKGEMYRWAADRVGESAASELLSSTHSCAHTGQRTFGVSIATPCGVCFGCVVRRASFLAADLDDLTQYADPTGNDRLARWLSGKSVEEAIRRFADRGVADRDLIAIGLPSTYRLAEVRDLCRRGVDELRALVG